MPAAIISSRHARLSQLTLRHYAISERHCHYGADITPPTLFIIFIVIAMADILL
jgi:hypothetical protein